jgi:hypothetical protein
LRRRLRRTAAALLLSKRPKDLETAGILRLPEARGELKAVIETIGFLNAGTSGSSRI